MSELYLVTVDGKVQTVNIGGNKVALRTTPFPIHDWQPPLTNEVGLTVIEANGTVTIAGGVATFVYSGAGAGEVAFRNTTSFNVDFVAAWEMQAKFTKVGNRVANKNVFVLISDDTGANGLAGSFGDYADPASDYTYFHEVVNVGGVLTIIQESVWEEDTEYILRAVSDGATLKFYLNGVLKQTMDITVFGAAKIWHIWVFLVETAGASGDVILDDIWFDHADL